MHCPGSRRNPTARLSAPIRRIDELFPPLAALRSPSSRRVVGCGEISGLDGDSPWSQCLFHNRSFVGPDLPIKCHSISRTDEVLVNPPAKPFTFSDML